MPDSNFIWNGPVDSAELTQDGKMVFSAMLHPGKSYAMPADHPVVESWKVSGLITADTGAGKVINSKKKGA